MQLLKASILCVISFTLLGNASAKTNSDKAMKSSPVLTLTTLTGYPKITNNNIYITNDGVSTVKIKLQGKDAPAQQNDKSLLTNGGLLVGTLDPISMWVSTNASDNLPVGSVLSTQTPPNATAVFTWTPQTGTPQTVNVVFAAENIKSQKLSKSRTITINVGTPVNSVNITQAKWTDKTKKILVKGTAVPNVGYSINGLSVSINDAYGNTIGHSTVKGKVWQFNGSTLSGNYPSGNQIVAEIENVASALIDVAGIPNDSGNLPETPTPTVPISDTCTSANFSSAIYNAISIGMTMSQVEQTIGCRYTSTYPLPTSQAYIEHSWGILVNLNPWRINVAFDPTDSVVKANNVVNGVQIFKNRYGF